jgi:hypothetical protein
MALGTRRRMAYGGVSPRARQAALHGAEPGAGVVLTQYGVNSTGFLMRACVVDSVPSTLTNSDVESIAQPSNPANQVPATSSRRW